MENTSIVYEYCHPSFCEADWLRQGGFVAVVLGYNHQSCIDAAIEGALRQDYPTYEIFLMDDCSRDGTLDRMIAQAKRFATDNTRPIRLRVTRNAENQSVCGQWNAVSKLSKGIWFGMFCGDDESFPNRISVVSDIIRRHPGALGVCTNFRPKGVEGAVYFSSFQDERVWSGDKRTLPLSWTFGCAAFWRKEIFNLPLRRGNLDDHQLLWRVLSLGAGQSGVSYVWAMDKVTVAYSMTTGVTNKLVEEGQAGDGWWRVHLRNARAFRKWITLVMGREITARLQEYDEQCGRDGNIRCRIRGYALRAKALDGNWFSRHWNIFVLLVQSCFDDFGGARRHVLSDVFHYAPRLVLGDFGYCFIDAIRAACRPVKDN